MTKSINVLGLSAYYHDSAATLLVDGHCGSGSGGAVYPKKHDAAFPANAIAYCLDEAGLSLDEIDYVTFYDKPLVKFERLLETYLAFAPKGFRSFVMAIPIWLKEKLFLKVTLKRELAALSGLEQTDLPPSCFTNTMVRMRHPPFMPAHLRKQRCLFDGVGEWATSSVWLGDESTLTPQWEIQFPIPRSPLLGLYLLHGLQGQFR